VEVNPRSSRSFAHRLRENSVIQLIERLHDVDRGRILFDDLEIKSLNVDWLLTHINVVNEESLLFVGSIEENIRLGKPNPTDEEVIAVAKMVHLPDLRLFHPHHHRLFRCHLETSVLVRRTTQWWSEATRSSTQTTNDFDVVVHLLVALARSLILLDEATNALGKEVDLISTAAQSISRQFQ
jgi:hypothetical protein